ncbi:MAG: CaiB/BaiF CoA transferase family protein [Planctomycetota bacterium]|jgi:crotonobetainyl-CoA:carnitine CoA-transferase CaiB-like acyl-CoA transferase
MPGEPGSSLAELRVLDLSDGVAGGYCGKLFADCGADVLKVEPPSGDPTRRHGPFPHDRPDREAGALWLYLGTSKRSVTLDISQPTGQRLLRWLVEDANVIVESFAPGHLQSLGLGFEALTSIKRRIVLVSITPYGQSGPKAGWRATNLTSFASGGQMSLTGEPDREPLVNAGYQAKYQAGLQAFSAAAVAAHQADVAEVPQHVDISAQECMASALELYLPWWAYLKRDISRRGGNVLSSMVGVFSTADGHIGLHIMPRNWPWFARAMGREDLIDDPRFRDNYTRLKHNDELMAIVHAWAAGQKAKEVYREAGAARVPIGFVHTLGDLLESEQLQARDYFQEVEHPVAGRRTYPGPPFCMSEVEWRAGRAPLLGEHNREVYCEELGVSDGELARLRAAGVV